MCQSSQFFTLSFQESLTERVQTISAESKNSSDRFDSELESLRCKVSEEQSLAARSGDKISRLEEIGVERQERLKAAMAANERIEDELRNKVK
jgi:hypothetical protein